MSLRSQLITLEHDRGSNPRVPSAEKTSLSPLALMEPSSATWKFVSCRGRSPFRAKKKSLKGKRTVLSSRTIARLEEKTISPSPMSIGEIRGFAARTIVAQFHAPTLQETSSPSLVCTLRLPNTKRVPSLEKRGDQCVYPSAEIILACLLRRSITMIPSVPSPSGIWKATRDVEAVNPP